VNEDPAFCGRPLKAPPLATGALRCAVAASRKPPERAWDIDDKIVALPLQPPNRALH
jgi:hypothetical protein